MAAPMTPLERVASAIKIQQAHIQFRQLDLLFAVCANNRLHRAATKNADRPISRELKWPLMTHIGLDASTTAANHPALALKIRAPVKPMNRIVRKPVRAVHRRACQSPMPNT